MSIQSSVATWFVAGGTLILAIVAVFQDSIRGLVYRPRLRLSAKAEPPDCVMVPLASASGIFVADSIYLRVLVENFGNATAKYVEVDARELRHRQTDGRWERVHAFPPMNLKWANSGGATYFPRIAPSMRKHCDVGHVIDPNRRQSVSTEVNPRLSLTPDQTSLAFDLAVSPNHRGNIVGPGDYELDVSVAAENAAPTKWRISVSLTGVWHADESTMLRDGIRIAVSQFT